MLLQTTSALRAWRKLAMSKAFSAWCACMDVRDDQRILADAALMRLMHGLEAEAFAAWRERASYQTKMRTRMKHYVLVMQNQVIVSAWVPPLERLLHATR